LFSESRSVALCFKNSHRRVVGKLRLGRYFSVLADTPCRGIMCPSGHATDHVKRFPM
jgi:hypothetical protein